jgi:hypothetical protein
MTSRALASVSEEDALPYVREKVRQLLTRSKAFQSLPPEKRKQVAHDMVKVGRFIVDGNGETRGAPVAATLTSRGDILNAPGTTAGDRFKAAAAQGGTAAYTDMVQKVNFPSFVGGLIDGVFNAIVTSSIKQMEAYAELVKNVSKSVDQYMKDNITPNQARDFLVDKYPGHLELDLSDEQAGPKVKPKEGADEDNMPDFFADLGLQDPVQSLDQDTIEEQLVPAARQRLAMDRQQMLATMVMMGINRLVVTNGSIKASCLFRLDTTDRVKAAFSKQAQEEDWQYQRRGHGFWGWFSPTSGVEMASFSVQTNQSEDSEATSKLHADLSGKVDLNFKSETFPLDKMTEILGVQQEKLKPKTIRAARDTAPAGPPPPMPTLPTPAQ